MVSSNIREVVDIARSYAWWGRGCYCVGQQNLLSNGVCGKRFSDWLENDTIVDHKYVFGVRGYNLKPLDLQGAIGQIQVKKFDDIHQIRRKNKKRIQNIFETISGVRVVNERKESETSWFGVPIICDSSNLKRSLVSYLEENKIQTRNYFAGNILLHPGYRDLGDGTKYPNASKVLNNVFFVGCAPVITSEMIDYIEEVILNFSM
jgi:CDP-6-deoxy-D-xylo-4-hexulose-3-dehydrase